MRSRVLTRENRVEVYTFGEPDGSLSPGGPVPLTTHEVYHNNSFSGKPSCWDRQKALMAVSLIEGAYA